MLRRGIRFRWCCRMAWRDARRGWGRLALYFSAVLCGVAAMGGIDGLRLDLQNAVEREAQILLGGDVLLQSRIAPGPESEEVVGRIPAARRSHAVYLTSMASFPASDAMRLVQVRAVDSSYPLAGELETDPAGALAKLPSAPVAVVDAHLLQVLELKPGATIRIGDQDFVIAAALTRVPGEVLGYSLVAPRVYIADRYLPETHLLGFGSQARYRTLLQFAAGTDVDTVLEPLRKRLQELKIDVETAARRQDSISKSIDRVSRFLVAAALGVMILAGIGVAGAVSVYLRTKRKLAAVLLSLGALPSEVLAIGVLQCVAVAAIGAVCGVGCGAVLQRVLVLLFADVLPVVPDRSVHMGVLWTAALCGLVVSGSWCFVPLARLRGVLPLAILRDDSERRLSAFAVVVAAGCTVCLMLGGSAFRLQSLRGGGLLVLGMCLALAVFALCARLAVWALRMLSAKAPFAVRQGAANLGRPNNQTVMVIALLGFSAALVTLLEFSRAALVRDFALSEERGQPNLVLFDVQREQTDDVARLVRASGGIVGEAVPIVAMKLTAVNGKATAEVMKDGHVPDWVVKREYRSTYRRETDSSERVVAGEWPSAAAVADGRVPVSIEKGIAKDLGVGLGDTLAFEVSGKTLTAEIRAVREVEWRRVQPNFFLVFPPEALEKAPASYAVTARFADESAMARCERAVNRKFPGVSFIDLRSALEAIESVLKSLGVMIEGMSAFAFFAAVLVLIGALSGAAEGRVRESALLKVLGAQQGTVRVVLGTEYAALGAAAALCGTLVGGLASFAVCRYYLDAEFRIAWPAFAAVMLWYPVWSVFFGIAVGTRGYQRPALEVLRLADE